MPSLTKPTRKVTTAPSSIAPSLVGAWQGRRCRDYGSKWVLLIIEQIMSSMPGLCLFTLLFRASLITFG